MARSITALSQYVELSPGAVVGTGAFTLLALVHPTSVSGTRYMLTAKSAAGNDQISLRIASTTFATRANGANVSYSSPPAPSANVWYLVAATKASGTQAVRLHVYDYSAAAWSRVNSTTTHADLGSGLTGIVFGCGTALNVSNWSGALAAGALWDRSLADAELDPLPYSLAAWHSARPTAMWVLDQAATSMRVRDLTGGGADQTAELSTAVSTLSVPVLSYGHPIIAATREGGGAATVTGTVTAGLGGLAATAAGQRTVHGTATVTLGTLTAAAAGQRTVHAVAAASLGGLSATAQGGRTVNGTLTASLGALNATAAGQRTVHAAATVALGGLTATAVAAVAAVRASSAPSVTARRTSTAAAAARRTSTAAVTARRTSTSTVEG